MDMRSADTAVFGMELRRRRVEAGLSLTGLERLVHYSRSHLSKVETGGKRPSPDLARRCDAALSCHGALAALAPAPFPDPDEPESTESDEVWVLSLSEDGGSGFAAVSRRGLLAGGLTGLAVPGRESRSAAGSSAPRADPETIAAFAAMFGELRRVGQRLGPAVLMPTLVSNTHALRSMARHSRPAQREAALALAARYAEYTGWMAQEAGDDAQAVWWTGQAAGLAVDGGDPEMASYALVRRGLIALYRHDARATIALAEQAGARARSARVRGLAAQREAQGHALAGEYDACFRALDQAALLLDASATGGGSESAPGAAAGRDLVLGTSTVPDPVAAATGWCLFDLGYPDRAADALRRELDRIAPDAVRARARYGARLALALAASGEPEEACVVAGPVADACARIDSATVLTDVRDLSRTLNRWHTRPDVRETRLRLTAVLHGGR